MQAGDTYQIKSTADADLTGTSVNSTKPIVLYSGCVGTVVPINPTLGSDNPLMEQLLPFDRWSNEYIGLPMKTHETTTSSSHPMAYYRITAGRKYTNVQVYNGNTGVTDTYQMDKGDKQDIITLDPIIVSSDKPIQAMQLATGEDVDHMAGDPMMMPMIASASPNNLRGNWMTNANIYVPSNEAMAGYYVTLVSETHMMSTMYLNGNPINGWQGIGNTRYEYVRLALAPGNNVINGVYNLGAAGQTVPAKFVATTYGFNEYDAEGAAVGGAVFANDYVNIKPSDPTPLIATAASAHEIDLSWTASQDAYGYRIERKTDTTDWAPLNDVQSATYQDTGLPHKAKYYYRVTAYADVDSNVSNVANATTLNEAPTTPHLDHITALNDSQIKVDWTDNSDNEDHFQVQHSLNQSTWVDVQTTDLNVVTLTESNLTKKTQYFYRLRARNDAGDSGWSNVLSDTTKDTKPNDPTGLNANAVSYNRVRLTWTDNSNNEDYFRVERQNASGGFDMVGTSSSNVALFDDYTVVGSTSYTYRVYAVNNGGDSLHPAGPATCTTPAPPIPNPPSGLYTISTPQTTATIGWTDNSDCEIQFIVERSPDGSTGWGEAGRTSANVTTFTDSNLTSSTTYWYRVKATNLTGTSDPCAPANANTLADSAVVGPQGVPKVCYSIAADSNTINVYWTPSSGSTSYKVYRGTTEGGSKSYIGSVTPTFGNQRVQKYIDSGLTTDADYYYVVTAVNASGESGPTEETSDSPTSETMPVNQSPQAILQWAVGQQVSDDDMPFVDITNVQVLMPDGTVIDSHSSDAQYDEDNVSLDQAPPQDNLGQMRPEEAGGQISRLSQAEARHIVGQFNPSTVSYLQQPLLTTFANITFDTTRDSIISSYSPAANPNRYVPSGSFHGKTETINYYIGFSSWNGPVPTTWAGRRFNNVNIEAGFGLNHYGAPYDPRAVQALRYVPFFRSANTGQQNGERYILSMKTKTPFNYFRADIEANPTLGGLGQNQTNLRSDVYGNTKKDRYASAKVQALLNGTSVLFVGATRNVRLAPLERHIRAKLGIGLDQTVDPNNLANDWISEPDANVYFKRGRYPSGSKAKVLVPSDALRYSATDPNPDAGGGWDTHLTSGALFSNFGGTYFGNIHN